VVEWYPKYKSHKGQGNEIKLAIKVAKCVYKFTIFHKENKYFTPNILHNVDKNLFKTSFGRVHTSNNYQSSQLFIIKP
jgi:ERCC4-type nuclease